MVPLIFTLEKDAQKFENFKKRGFKTILRNSLKVGLKHLHKKYMHLYFERSAYKLFRDHGYKRVKKQPFKPMVETGKLRGEIMRRPGRGAFRFTARTSTMVMSLPYGAPPQYTESKIVQLIVRELVKKYGWDKSFAIASAIKMRRGRVAKSDEYKYAEGKVSKRIGYGPAQKWLFQRRLTGVFERQARDIANVQKQSIIRQLNANARKKKKVIRG